MKPSAPNMNTQKLRRDVDVEDGSETRATPHQHSMDMEQGREPEGMNRLESGSSQALAKLETESMIGPQSGWRYRIRYFTWTFFTLTMATGGIANVIFSCPLEFHGLYAIGVIVMILNILFFVINCICMSLRFYYWPQTFRASFSDETESLFVPAPVISISIILITITQYAVISQKTGPWLTTTMTIFYWIYIALAFVASVAIYLNIWASQTHAMSTMTPIWIFPAYPLLLVGPFAGQLSSQQTGARAIEIIVGGVIVQGIGFMVSLTIYAAYISRLMTEKLPAESSRPAMFISVGPSAFTISGLINMGQNIGDIIDDNFMDNGRLAAQVSRILANWVGIWLWGLALWFFFVSVFAHWTCVSHGRMRFAMTWNSFIFPNTGLALATFAVATALGDNRPIQIIGAVMLCALIVLWFFVFSMMMRAIYLKQILWPSEEVVQDQHGDDIISVSNGHSVEPTRSSMTSSARLRKRRRESAD